MRIHLRATASFVALTSLLLTGCAAAEPPSTGSDHADTAMPHVHTIVPAPDGDGFVLGTHEGLYAATADGQLGARVGSYDFDAMVLTAVDGTLIASGHPGRDTPAELGEGNLGIIRSRDGGATWEAVAFTGEKDFHVLTAGPDGTLYGQGTGDGLILASTDLGATWAPTGTTLLVFGLAVDATGRIVAATPDGLRISTDRGATFSPLSDAPSLYVIASSPDREGLVGVGTNGAIWSSTTTDPRWQNVGSVHDSVQAITVTDAGDMLIVDDSGISRLPLD
ncbi:F510_1955 family glycosylhydrolase [Microbacterium aurum]